uniref:Orf134 n=1 Tax=Batis maritima TaxID=4436 RepID=A0A068BEC5_BATMA|nr:orf134 [Batis maritima]AIC83411.1 orf134 [Batis maritima]
MIRSAPFSVATMAVLNHIGCTSLQVSLRLRGAGFRRYSAKAGHFNNNHNRHWYRHLIVAYSPGGKLPLPFYIWFGFTEGGPPLLVQGSPSSEAQYMDRNSQSNWLGWPIGSYRQFLMPLLLRNCYYSHYYSYLL